MWREYQKRDLHWGQHRSRTARASTCRCFIRTRSPIYAQAFLHCAHCPKACGWFSCGTLTYPWLLAHSPSLSLSLCPRSFAIHYATLRRCGDFSRLPRVAQRCEATVDEINNTESRFMVALPCFLINCRETLQIERAFWMAIWFIAVCCLCITFRLFDSCDWNCSFFLLGFSQRDSTPFSNLAHLFESLEWTLTSGALYRSIWQQSKKTWAKFKGKHASHPIFRAFHTWMALPAPAKSIESPLGRGTREVPPIADRKRWIPGNCAK